MIVDWIHMTHSKLRDCFTFFFFFSTFFSCGTTKWNPSNQFLAVLLPPFVFSIVLSICSYTLTLTIPSLFNIFNKTLLPGLFIGKVDAKKNFMAPFYGWGSTASRLQPLWGGSLLFTIQFPELNPIFTIQSTLEPPSGFEHGTPGLGIQHLNH